MSTSGFDVSGLNIEPEQLVGQMKQAASLLTDSPELSRSEWGKYRDSKWGPEIEYILARCFHRKPYWGPAFLAGGVELCRSKLQKEVSLSIHFSRFREELSRSVAFLCAHQRESFKALVGNPPVWSWLGEQFWLVHRETSQVRPLRMGCVVIGWQSIEDDSRCISSFTGDNDLEWSPLSRRSLEERDTSWPVLVRATLGVAEPKVNSLKRLHLELLKPPKS